MNVIECPNECIKSSCVYWSDVSVRNHPIKVLQHDQQLVLAGAYDRVQLIQTQPVFTAQLTKALLVLGPIAVEIDRSIIATLEYDPITTEAVISLGRRDYLNDYQLKQDLVRKLPPTNQLQWFRFVGARTLFHATLDHLSEFLRLIALDISELEPYRPKPGKRNGGGKKKSNRNGNGD
uniref:Uncharacterized protein n=1 Tax=Anopheles melas TaxID=34690 RepID=A0A182TCX2_9DIPT